MRGAFAEAWANRSDFWSQVAAMVANDIVWVVFWVLFFERVGTVRGWDTGSVMLLLAAVTTSCGLVLGFLNNACRIGRLASDGELDATLALPTSPLAHLLVRRVATTNLGDLGFGVVLFAVACDPTPARTAVFLVCVATGALLLTGFLVATGSLAFFVGRTEAGQLGFHAMLVFATYPADIFTGATKLLVYTVVPAAFVGAVPAHLIEDFDPWLAAGALAVAAAFAATGWALFHLGLRRYTSGAVWTQA
jgi:ABC-2 type transport system permease protein